MSFRTGAAALLLSLSAGAAGAATFLAPVPYLSSADIPFGLYDAGQPVFIEDFEGGAVDSRITGSAGGPLKPGLFTDSVDADDGAIDGFGNLGWSYSVTNGFTGIMFTFENPVTAAGLAVTDGRGFLQFEAFDAYGDTLGAIGGFFGDSLENGGTAEDMFYGVREDDDGISAIFVKTFSTARLEVETAYRRTSSRMPRFARAYVVLRSTLPPRGFRRSTGRCGSRRAAPG